MRYQATCCSRSSSYRCSPPLVLVFVPSEQKDARRASSVVVSGARAVRLAVYIFIAYQITAAAIQFIDALRTWLENVGFLGKNGITLHLGIDGIAAPMVLLTGIVAFAGTLISLEDRVPQQGLLHPLLGARRGRLRHVHLARPVLLLLLLRARRAAAVPADRGLGLSSVPNFAQRNTAR